ncbi:MAG: exosortase/archaeosortase family protein [Dysgonamonadaceae bacterium]|nr:exosortase/archaeosortase family protein [Dysgonamonadaceae bacterium]
MNKRIPDFIKPYTGILWFLALLFFFHFSWKIAIDGDMAGDMMYLFGKDITPPWFLTLDRWLTQAVAWFVRLFPNTGDLIVEPQALRFPGNPGGIGIVWGCTGVKQIFIFTGIMLLYRGPFLKKLYYIPLGWLILTVYNVARIGLIVILTNGHQERYNFLHDGIFRFIYYGIVFMLWVYWEEFIANKQQKNKINDERKGTNQSS